MFSDISEFRLKSTELDIVRCFDAQDGPAKDEKFTDDRNRRTCNLAQRRDEEETHGGDEDTAGETGHCDDALQAREFYFLLRFHHLLILVHIFSFHGVPDKKEFDKLVSCSRRFVGGAIFLNG